MSDKRIDDFLVIDNGKSSKVQDTDHGKPNTHPNPHAHDINGSWGNARPLTENEKIAYDEYKNYPDE